MRKVFFILILSLNLLAQTIIAQPNNLVSTNLLRELLDLSSPPPKQKTDEDKRSEGFYDDKNPPPDNAPIEDLLDYWRKKAMDGYSKSGNPPVPSVKTSLRLIDAMQDDSSGLQYFLSIFPLEKEIMERVKQLYDLKHASSDVSEWWLKSIKDWLKYNSDFYADELLAEAQEAKDNKNYSTVNKSQQLSALAKVDWEKAAPLLEKLESDKTNPRTLILAKRLLYEHALKEKDENIAEKYRSELKAFVEDKSALGEVRDLAFDALTENTEWTGFDDWYLSLLADETLLELRLSENSITNPLIVVTNKNPEKWIPILSKLVGSKNLNVHNAAVNGLAEIADEKPSKVGLLPLLPWLTNPDWAKDTGSRGKFIRSLRMVDMPESIPGLIWLVENEDDEDAADVLAVYKDSRAVPALRIALSKTPDERTRESFVYALIACGGFSDAGMVEAIQSYVETILTTEGYTKVEERDEWDDETPLPLTISVGKFIARLKTPAESFVRALFEHIKELQKSKPFVAKKLLEIANKWQGKTVDAEIVKRIADGKADVDTILTVLARRDELRESIPLELTWLTGKSGLARAVGVAVLEDETQMLSLINQTDAETQIAVLACARLLRLKLSVREIGDLLNSPNKLIALAAERYLESEDSREARDLVLAKHKGEALILGARDSFNPAKKKIIRDYSGQSSSWRTPLDNLFSSVNGSYLYPDNYDGFNEAFDKNEEKLRKELLENNDLKEIYNFGGNTVRVYQNNKAIFLWEKDKAFFYETVLTKEELDSFKNGIIERKLDELGPSKSSCHYDCSAGEFIQLNRDGGRRTFYYGGLGLSFYFQGIFWELQNSKNLKLNFWLEKYVKGLEVFPFDHRYTLKAMWKNGDDFRILVADNSLENIIREELRKLNEVDNNNEDLDYSEKEILRFEREKVREFEHLEWRKFEKGKLSGLIEEPTAIPYLMEKQQFPAFKNIDNNDSSFQSRTQNFEIRGGINQKGGLWKIGIGGSLIQIKEGVYANPIITPDGKWAVVSKAKENWSEPNFIYRISLQTGKEYKINIPAADNLNAVAFVQAHGKILIEKSDEKGYERINEKYFLIDPQTGIVQEVKGQFRPLKHQTYRPLQSNNVPNEFWAAISDGKDTEVGIYNTKLFSFRAVIKLPQIVLNSMDIWADESEQKIYIIYNYWGQESFLLSFPLPQKTVQTKQ